MIKKLFLDLAWPAFAGNVLWAIFTVVVNDKWNNEFLIKFLLLVILSLYLCFNWLRLHEIHSNKRQVSNGNGEIQTINIEPKYWILDALHLITIALFANIIANPVQSENGLFVFSSLISIYLFAICGHIFHVWAINNEPNKAECLMLALANFSGFLPFIIFSCSCNCEIWVCLCSLALVIFLWFCLRQFVIGKNRQWINAINKFISRYS